MKLAKWTALTVLLVMAGGAGASDPTGIYALVDRVVIESNGKSPQHIQIWGAFCLAKGRAGEDYHQPFVGYMYFRLPGNNADAARKEWADLKKVAGTGICVGFASRFDPKGTVRRGSEKPARPDAFPVAGGIYKINNNHPTARLLRSLAAPRSPHEGEKVEPGAVTLRVRNLLDDTHKEARYVFAISSSEGEQERSDPVKAGSGETQWTPRLKVKSGVKYTWTVQAVDDDWKGPVSLAIFHGKAQR
jgi:hypothetical protein